MSLKKNFDGIKQFEMILNSIDNLVPKTHILRKYETAIDWNFIYDLTKDLYSNTTEYKLQHNGNSPKHDWYEYIEYESTKKINIFLQRCDFSSDTSEFIKQQRRNYIVETNEGYKIKKSLLNLQHEQTRLEAAVVILNYPELFID